MKNILQVTFILTTIVSTNFARVNFIHIPKCAGTTIHSMLEKSFHVDEIYPQRHMPKFTMDGCLDSVDIDHALVSGHFPFWFYTQKDPEIEKSFTFTILRDPVQRVFSHSRYIAKTEPEKNGANPLTHRPNWIARMLCSDPTFSGDVSKENRVKYTEEEIFQDCIQNLKKLDLVLFVDEDTFNSGVQHLFDSLNIPFNEHSIPVLNVTKAKKVSPEVLRKVRKRNQLDIRIYEYAKKHFPLQKYLKKQKKKKQSLESLQEKTKPNRSIIYDFDQPMIGSSWHRREDVGLSTRPFQYIRDKNASIEFNVIGQTDYQMHFYARAIAPDIYPSVRVNETKLLVKRNTVENFSRYSVFIPKSVIGDGHLKIEFCANKNYAMNKKYPHIDDTRKLSYALNRIALNPISYNGE